MDRTLVKVGGQQIRVAQPSSASSWQEAVATFVACQNLKQTSRHLYVRQMTLFFTWVEETGRDISSLTLIDIQCYKDYLQYEKKLSNLTVGSYLTSLRKFYTWAESIKIYPNIAKGVSTPKRKQEFIKQHIPEDKSADLLRFFATQSLRDFAIVNLAIRTGLRTIEIVRADFGDITSKGGKRILRIWGKGRDDKSDYVVLSDKAWEPIKAYLATRPKVTTNEPLFASDSHRNAGERLTTRTISGIIKNGLRAIGLDGREYTAHSLRHTTAVTMLRHGASLMDAQHVLRHTDPKTTQIYLESIKEEMRLEKAPELILDNIF